VTAGNGSTGSLVLVDDPAEGVRRITLNRPEKRNALNNPLRGALLAALRDGDTDDAVRVIVVRGAGTCFSAGYDLGGGNEGAAARREQREAERLSGYMSRPGPFD